MIKRYILLTFSFSTFLTNSEL